VGEIGHATYEAEDDRGFAHGSFAWLMWGTSADVRGGEGGSGWQEICCGALGNRRLTEQDELDLDRLVCGSRCSVGH
jgi:hypothetical protein